MSLKLPFKSSSQSVRSLSGQTSPVFGRRANSPMMIGSISGGIFPPPPPWPPAPSFVGLSCLSPLLSELMGFVPGLAGWTSRSFPCAKNPACRAERINACRALPVCLLDTPTSATPASKREMGTCMNAIKPPCDGCHDWSLSHPRFSWRSARQKWILTIAGGQF